MDWLMPANGLKYDHYASFKENGHIDWHQTVNFAIGDTVYIYCTAPHQIISYKTIVVDVHMDFTNITDDKKFWKKIEYYEKAKSDKFCRLVFLEEFYNENLTLEKLKTHGLKSAPQKPQRLNDRLKHYITAILKENDALILGQNSFEFEEGTIILKQHLSRERNSSLIATEKEKFKTEHDGRLFCEVCGFDSYEKYGKIGDNFIEARHSKPLSEMKECERTNINDIIMLCSNCHSMIHRKRPWLNKEQLKELLNSSKT